MSISVIQQVFVIAVVCIVYGLIRELDKRFGKKVWYIFEVEDAETPSSALGRPTVPKPHQADTKHKPV